MDVAAWGEVSFGASPLGVAVFDAAGTYAYVNDVLAGMNGIPASAHLGRHPVALFGDHVGEWFDRVRSVLQTGDAVPAFEVVTDAWGPLTACVVSVYPVGSLPGATGGPWAVVVARETTSEYVERTSLQALAAGAPRLASASTVEEVASAAVEITSTAVPRARATFAVAERYGLRLTAFGGYSPDWQAAWTGSLLPVTVPAMITDAARTGHVQTAWDREDVLGRHAGLDQAVKEAGLTSMVSVPILVDGEVAAVLDVGLTGGSPLHQGLVNGLVTLAALASAAIDRVRRTASEQERRLAAAFDAMLENVTIAEAVRDDDGVIVDFRLVYANAHSRDGVGRPLSQLVGGSVAELYPGLRADGLFDAYVQVVQTGRPFVDEERRYRDLIDGRPLDGWWSLRVTRLGDGYLAASRDVTDAVRARQAAADAIEAQRQEREAVHLLQRFALPVRLPAQPGVDIAAAHLPAGGQTPLGGDWYDAFTLADGRMGLVIGDVAGHGRDAAEAMIAVRRYIGALRHDNISPGTALALANDHLLHHGEAMVTCCYAVLDTTGGAITIATAGHPPAILRDLDGARAVEVTPGIPLGGLPDQAYPETTVQCSGPAVLVLYTDGLVERRGQDMTDSIDHLIHTIEVGPTDATGLRDNLAAAFGGNDDDDACILIATTHT